MKKYLPLTLLLAVINIMTTSCIMPINCLCNKSAPVPEIEKPRQQHHAIEISNKLISHFLILNNKIVMELRMPSSSVLFDGESVLGFLIQEKNNRCALHALTIYDFDQDKHADLLELDTKLFQWSATDKNKLYVPEFGYAQKDAVDLIQYADEIFNQYRLIFENGGGIQQKEGTLIEEIHDLYFEKYWEFYAKGCNIKIEQPTINDLAFFDPRKQ